MEAQPARTRDSGPYSTLELFFSRAFINPLLFPVLLLPSVLVLVLVLVLILVLVLVLVFCGGFIFFLFNPGLASNMTLGRQYKMSLSFPFFWFVCLGSRREMENG